MSFFDFFFPEQAQASHLRRLAEQGQFQTTAVHRQRLQEAQQRRQELSRTQSLEQRIAQLEQDLGQAGLAIEALLELLEQSGVVTREALAARIQEIDSRDGVVDGRMTPPQPEPFTPARQWPGTTQS
jgi:chromosome condensin MukBEF ATPase and DNA-binding subunit MukB